MGHSIIIVHSSPFLPRFRSLWATCMTVTMTASGAQLLLLALCVCRGSAMQQSSPRVRLSFKGELIQINQNSSDSRNCHASDFSLVFPTHAAVFPLYTFVKTVFPATCQTAQHWKQKVDITCGWSGYSTQEFSPRPKSGTHYSLTCHFCVWHDDKGGNTWNLITRVKWPFRTAGEAFDRGLNSVDFPVLSSSFSEIRATETCGWNLLIATMPGDYSYFTPFLSCFHIKRTWTCGGCALTNTHHTWAIPVGKNYRCESALRRAFGQRWVKVMSVRSGQR